MREDPTLPPPHAPHKRLTQLTIRGYKSLANCHLDIQSVNVLIGANGAGKSNLMSLFRLMPDLLAQRLQLAVGLAGGPDALLHFGSKITPVMGAQFHFGDLRYEIELAATANNRLVFHAETVADIHGTPVTSQGYLESETPLYDSHGGDNRLDSVLAAMRRWQVYHFSDASPSARMKAVGRIHVNESLAADGGNLAAFLYRLSRTHPQHLSRITKTIRLIAPYFDAFALRPRPENPETIELEWREREHGESFTASALSDGTLRFICLATALLQPEELMPTLLLIDEPELGLHPFAIHVLAGLIQSVGTRRQVIVATQSVELLNAFDIGDVVVVDRHQSGSVLRRPDANGLAQWLEDYSLGELWNKNLLGGRPAR
jgi:predicted ATPase